MVKNLLIVEESLRDLKAHWFEYIKTIAEEAEQRKWSVEVVCHHQAASEIQQTLYTFPRFRYARYLDNARNRLPGDRYYGFILHSWRSLKILWPLLSQQSRYDLAFTPTVLMHHLLAWWIIMTFHPNKPKHLTLFFVTNPGVWNQQSQSAVLPKSSILLGKLLQMFSSLVKQDSVTLAVETRGAKREFESLTSLPFKLMPHPVPNAESSTAIKRLESLNFACYGFARYEKGSDLLQSAVERILERDSSTFTNFSIQWVDSFALPDGSLCEVSEQLKQDPRVTIVARPLVPEEYQKLLRQTSCMILPYRNASYHARVSRIAIEAACLGIPTIYTKGGWLEETIDAYGAGIGIADESEGQLIEAIEEMNAHYDRYHQMALSRADAAIQYFSADSFCQQLLCDA